MLIEKDNCYLSFFFFSFSFLSLKRMVTGFRSRKEELDVVLTQEDDTVVLMDDTKNGEVKQDGGPPSVNVTRMQQNLWNRDFTVCTSGQFQFLIYKREEIICQCFGNQVPELPGYPRRSWMFYLSCSLTANPAWMDVSYAPGHFTGHRLLLCRQLYQSLLKQQGWDSVG